MKALICVYCGIETSTKEALEHIIPESLGSKDTLYPGAVCTKCNHKLGTTIDSKVFDEGMMAMGQVSSGAKGKRGVRKHIRSGEGTIIKSGDGGLIMANLNSGKPNEQKVARFLTKIAVNVLTNTYGSSRVRSNYPDLIRYVNMPKGRKDIWPYVATYTPLKPICVYGLSSRNYPALITPHIVWFICASGFFAIPLDRQSVRYVAKARSFIKEQIDRDKSHGGKFGPMISYEAKNTFLMSKKSRKK